MTEIEEKQTNKRMTSTSIIGFLNCGLHMLGKKAAPHSIPQSHPALSRDDLSRQTRKQYYIMAER